MNFLSLFRAQGTRALLFPSRELSLGQGQIAQSFFPFRFQSAGHEPVFGLDGTVLTLRPLRLIASTLQGQTPPIAESRWTPSES